MRFSLVMATLGVALFCSVPVFAEPPADCPHKDGMGKGKGMMEELNLTPDQKTKLKALREERQAAGGEILKQVKSIREKAKEELLKPNPGKSVLDDLARQNGEAHRLMAQKEQEHLLKVKAVLNQSQFEKVLSRDFINEMKCRRMGMGPGEGGCPPGCPRQKDGSCPHMKGGPGSGGCSK